MMNVYRRQSGAALIVSLIILIVLTVIALQGGRSVVMQEKMTAAVRDGHIALQIAEAGVLDAQVFIQNNVNNLSDYNETGTGGLYSLGTGPIDAWSESVWSDSTKIKTATTSIEGMVAQYYIEYMGRIKTEDDDLGGINLNNYGQTTGEGDVDAFKVVSRSLGKSGNSERIITALFGKRI
ncbi:PilX N-terminal domain-containing pilus assembly protein [Hahella aquimaris]|uniref:pilus assembly PilX family protein n=1 Tax=Hahella sp. HNIBRBA332 TaxID=3015983 RepID=UPI00273BF8BC|nr:PilX N-terminal domain-containing pilus assembly protein [Hahella sp. HNIBRBA332]WLQ14058.1 PilX N-terminal domain-containing pilus assembly protein [Hahella sp. HNIBRBA332]